MKAEAMIRAPDVLVVMSTGSRPLRWLDGDDRVTVWREEVTSNFHDTSGWKPPSSAPGQKPYHATAWRRTPTTPPNRLRLSTQGAVHARALPVQRRCGVSAARGTFWTMEGVQLLQEEAVEEPPALAAAGLRSGTEPKHVADGGGDLGQGSTGDPSDRPVGIVEGREEGGIARPSRSSPRPRAASRRTGTCGSPSASISAGMVAGSWRMPRWMAASWRSCWSSLCISGVAEDVGGVRPGEGDDAEPDDLPRVRWAPLRRRG